jgi:hypothetical protein
MCLFLFCQFAEDCTDKKTPARSLRNNRAISTPSGNLSYIDTNQFHCTYFVLLLTGVIYVYLPLLRRFNPAEPVVEKSIIL